MPKTSGGAEQVISLPKGGGALKGLGEKFQPDLHTGTGNFSVPLALPPGRNGLQPQLALTYSTGQGNGPFGLGWSLSVPGVTLKTSKGVPRYQGDDVYVLSGAEDLVLVKEDAASRLYRPRTEGLFARIIHHHATNNDYWEVRSKDGLVSLYGTPGTAGHDPAVVADPVHRTKAFAWKLTQTADPFGNRITYEYERDLGEEVSHQWDQLYLKRIRYVDYTAQGDTRYLVSVTFAYADRRDSFSDYRAGFEIRTTKRCMRIEMRTHTDQERLVRAYDLVYLDERKGLDQRLPYNGVSLLSQVKVTSYESNHGWAWGFNLVGQLGDGTATSWSTPGPLDRLNGVVAFTAGNAHSLALLENGTVWAWGDNAYGQLGIGTTTNSPAPVQVSIPTRVTAIAAGYNHNLALDAEGTVWAWGRNYYGEVGDGTASVRSAPVQVSGLTGVSAIAVGGHSLALKPDGTVWAWGFNSHGTCGDGTEGAARPHVRMTPIQVVHLSGVVAMAAVGHSLALKPDGTVWAWGLNVYGEVGDGTTSNRSTPVRVNDLPGVRAVAAGSAHSLVLRDDGTVWAWGANSGVTLGAPSWHGQLGDGTTSDRSMPVQVSGLMGVSAIAAGGAHSLALTPDGTVWAWGVNHMGQVGDGTETDRLTPVQVSNLTSAVAIAAGIWHSLALTRPVSSPPMVEEMPPLAFRYTTFKPAGRRFLPLQGQDLPARSLANPDLELVDLFGNGLPDILEMNGTVRYWRNLGAGQYDRPRDMREAPAGVGLADQGVQLLDANGDGRMDLLVTTESLAGYYPLQFGGLWDRRSFKSYSLGPSFNLEDPEVRLVDLNGDGVTDALRSGSRFECFFNNPKHGWKDTRWVERRSLEDFPNVNFSDPRVKWADMSGDGLQDIVLVHDGSVAYWPNLAYGSWGKRRHMRNSPRFPYGYDPKRILMGDVDGDGLADLVYVDASRVTLWINQSGNGWSDPIVIQGTPAVSDMESVRLADMLGTGVSGLLWSQDAGGPWRHPMYFLDFTGSVKPYLLSEMDNHIGAVTKVAYAPSTRFYLRDQPHPTTRWQTPLPFPVQVVARVEVIDAISGGKLTTEYLYHHGYWDGAEREFRGFGMVEQLDSETFDTYNQPGLHGQATPFTRVKDDKRFAPPTLARTWFHQGPIGAEFGDWHERDLSNECWSGDPQVLKHVETVNEFLQRIPQRRVQRDALRALRGSILRTEVYALRHRYARRWPMMGHGNPFNGLREECEHLAGSDDEERLQFLFPTAAPSAPRSGKRGHDPMTQFTFTGEYDNYGQPCLQISVAVPRSRDYRETIPDSAPMPVPYLATHTVTVYATPGNAATSIVDHVARTTTYEIPPEIPAHRQDVWTLQGLIAAHTFSSPATIIGQSLHFYDGPAFEGLPFGTIGAYGALVRTETLVLTEDILHQAYRSGDTVASPPEAPLYLVPNGLPAWTAEYPQGFRDQLQPLAGYHFQDGNPATPSTRGYFVASTRRRYDFHDHPQGLGHGLVLAQRDPMGRDAAMTYDAYRLLPTQVTDPAGLTTRVSYDYRVLQPREVTEPNGNRTVYAFTPLGLLERTAVMGKAGENVGDTLTVPGARLVYDFLAFAERGQPISVRTIKRVHHVSETDVPQPEHDATIESIEYSDGFGRLLQTRMQAEDVRFGEPIFGDAGLPVGQPGNGDAVGRQRVSGDLPNVVVSGWQIYDNKGRVVEKYEPFFSTGWDYAPPQDTECGQKATIFYDPLGRVIRTVTPDGSEQRVLYGIPDQLADPPLAPRDTTKFSPTPWESYTYDANDNAGHTHHDQSLAYQHHWNTPASAEVDALGRTIRAVARNGANPATDWYTTRSSYDIRGNLLTVTDALGRVAFRHVYDLANRPLRIASLDAGIRRSVLDAAGNVIEGRDSKGALVLHAYDVLHRPIRLWAQDGSSQPLTLRERLVYGDSPDAGLSMEQAPADNLLGMLYRHYDEAGLLTLAAYDFKGNLLDKRRQVVADAAILAVFDPPPHNWEVRAFRVNWETPSATPLDATAYQTTLTYDALNRVKTMQYPQDVDGTCKVLRPHYNRAGTLERVELDGTTYVERIAYNARGQRTLIVYGNGVMTRYAYDSWTFRLVRLRSERYSTPAALTYRPTGAPLQDLAYQYDLAGNILTIQERTPGCGVLNNLNAFLYQGTDPALATLLTEGNALIRYFSYDPLYRLLSASGRECKDIPSPRPWCDEPRCGFNSGSHGTPAQDNAPDLTALYKEEYHYDPAGNMLSLHHSTTATAWVRHFGMGELNPHQWSQEWPSHVGTSGEWTNPPTNRLTHVGDNHPTIPQSHFFDANGNMSRETTSRHCEWDHADRLRVYRTQVAGAEPSVHAHYLYDASGQRVKKLMRKQDGQVDVTVYIDGIFEYHRSVQGSELRKNNTLHVMDNQSRIALMRVGSPFPGEVSPPMKYHLGDHLGSSMLVIDATGTWINREEYFPYGETSFGSFAKKRYRFTGKECDEGSGLYYHGARYYTPWLMRWASPDPAGLVNGPNLYAYVSNSPVCLVDKTGLAEVSPGVEGKWVEITIDHIQARVEGGAPLDPANLALSPRSDNSGKGARPEGARASRALQSLAEAEDFDKAAQRMVSGRFSETKELSDLWNKASNGQALAYDKAQGKFWAMVKEGTDADAKLVRQALEKAGIKFNEKLSRFTIDSKSTGLFSRYSQTEAQSLLRTLRSMGDEAGEVVASTGTKTRQLSKILSRLQNTAGKVASAAGKVASVVGPIFESIDLAKHRENRTSPGFMGLWTEVGPQSRNLDYPDGTPVPDSNGHIVGYIYGGRVRLGPPLDL